MYMAIKYAIFITQPFEKLFYTLEKSEQIWIDKIKKKLEENATGKPLGFEWFREKKYGNKGLYFLVDEKNKKILLIAFATKKDQQKVINFIKSNMKEFLDYLKNI